MTHSGLARILARILPSVLAVALGIGLSAAPAFAQGGTADISGTVFDQQKAVLPGVTVTVVNQATGKRGPPSAKWTAVSRSRRCCRAPTP